MSLNESFIAHEARTEAFWEAQHRHNAEINERMRLAEDRITTLEKRVMVVSFVASLLGSGAGAFGMFSVIAGG